jgi:hypothetical protein
VQKPIFYVFYIPIKNETFHLWNIDLFFSHTARTIPYPILKEPLDSRLIPIVCDLLRYKLSNMAAFRQSTDTYVCDLPVAIKRQALQQMRTFRQSIDTYVCNLLAVKKMKALQQMTTFRPSIDTNAPVNCQ